MKYCQECGNASYDSAPICGNCGAKLPPKSKENSTPPKRETKSNPQIYRESSIFSDNSSGFGRGLTRRFDNFDITSYSTTAKNQKEKEEAFLESSSKPSFSKTATIGFRQKDKGVKDPAKKFDSPKKETASQKVFKKETKAETPKEETKEVKKETKKETKKESQVSKEEIKPNIVKKEEKTGGLNFKKIGIVAIIAIIILIIAGIGLNMQNQTTNEVIPYTDGVISFDYSGNWSMYNNTDGNSNMTDMAFKTKDKTLIGFTTIQSDDITYDKILSDVNATAHSLNGELVDYKDIDIDGINSKEITISTQDQGYSRYVCILRDGIYYCFVINNGKSDNQNLTALNTTEINNMIDSISFGNSTVSGEAI